jgi:hypothetical protein
MPKFLNGQWNRHNRLYTALGNIMVLMGMWLLNIGLPSGRSKKSCPFCLARTKKRHKRPYENDYVHAVGICPSWTKTLTFPNPWTIPQKPYTFPSKRFATLLHTPRPTLKIPIKFRLLYFEDKLHSLRIQSLPRFCKIHTRIYMTCQIL